MSSSASGVQVLRMLSRGSRRRLRVNCSASSPVSGSLTTVADEVVHCALQIAGSERRAEAVV